jgi:aminoglycoside 2''-phosphotransferase
LGTFLERLHGIPKDALDDAGVSPSGAIRTREDWLGFYEQLEGMLFAHLWRHQRGWVNEHFVPVLESELDLRFEPALIHGDLATYHVLLDPSARRLVHVQSRFRVMSYSSRHEASNLCTQALER